MGLVNGVCFVLFCFVLFCFVWRGSNSGSGSGRMEVPQ